MLSAVVVYLNGVQTLQGQDFLRQHMGPDRVGQGDKLAVLMHHVHQLLVRQLRGGIPPTRIIRGTLPCRRQSDHMGAFIRTVFDIMLQPRKQKQSVSNQVVMGFQYIVVRHGEEIIPGGSVRRSQLFRRKHSVRHCGMTMGISLEPNTILGEIRFFHSTASIPVNTIT